MEITILGSGSRGNSLVVDCNGERILIDAGFAARTIAKRLQLANISPSSIHGLVLTHAHGDHALGARTAARRFGWTVYATPGTLLALPELRESRCIPIARGERLEFESMAVTAVRTPHDCVEPVALLVEERSSGARCGIAYDLGHVTDIVERALQDVDALVVETNYDPQMLRRGPYPRSVQERIAGMRGHLSNSDAADLVRSTAGAQHRLRHVVLAHLSAENNTPTLARDAVSRVVRARRMSTTVTVALQDEIVRVPVTRHREVEQLSLL